MSEREPHKLNPSNEATPTDPRIDPRLDALLDEALAPDDAPAGLNSRILAATADRLPAPGSVSAAATTSGDAVIARIGGGFPWRSAAAALLFALIFGGVWLAQRQAEDPTNNQPIVAHPPDDQLAAAAPIKVEAALSQLAESELRSEWIDERIDILSMQIAWAEDAGWGGESGGPGGWGVGAMESLDTAMARDEFDDLADEMELYF